MTREKARELLQTTPIDIRSPREDLNISDYFEALNMAIEALQERPKGRWIRHPHKLWTYECSCCGRLITMVVNHENVKELYPFCHCGADMRNNEE